MSSLFFMRVVLATLALFSSSAAAHAFTDCAASPAAERLHVQAVTLLPDPIVSGQTLKVQMHGANAGSAAVASGSAKLTAQVFGITVATLSFDLCTQLGVACPLAPNASFTAQLAYPIPGGAPPGVPITATIHVLDGAQAELTCIKMDLAIAPPHLVLNAVLNASSSSDAVEGWMGALFDAWLAQFNVSIAQAEYVPRLRVFADNHARIAAHNGDGDATWRMAHNQFSHLTQGEFAATHLAPMAPRRPLLLRRPAAAVPLLEALPAAVDWVAKGAVTPVKNQEQCGSCWAFSATGALEGAHFVKRGSLVSLSEQMLVDCDTTDAGCGGGSMDSAFDWAAQAGGLCAESAYAYTGQAGSCAAAKCARVAGSAPASHVDVEPNSDAALMAAVAAQPVAVAIEADQSGFQFYSSGVFSGTCGSQLDHGVLLVGYGTTSAGAAYYKVKNSWGGSWGLQGYVLLARGGGHEGGMCGILTSASYPVL